MMLSLTNFPAFATLACFFLLQPVFGGLPEHGDSSNPHSPSSLQKYRPKTNPSFKGPLPHAFERSMTLQNRYPPKSKHIDTEEQHMMTDHEQILAVSARQPRAETPTRSRLPIHRQISYKQAKDLEHAHNGNAKIYDHTAKQGVSTLEEKEEASMLGHHERVRAQSFGRKANAIVKNPNGPRTKWP
ncbi:uncharacterized protein FA14DRAFT_185027 [Meira miltonrushii]|uniref:Uncharacterized protein n=1 Tax=Meira miltonrushii TaxID=1280837 RepID=A0A316V6X1_9BASI|nr:uncharacterized protein FA14DRAFT_185027 [Meira miltonrushii]PWN33172.1 hypothetical protein FA14DRAFT_185027 [Meira miltonrushii]